MRRLAVADRQADISPASGRGGRPGLQQGGEFVHPGQDRLLVVDAESQGGALEAVKARIGIGGQVFGEPAPVLLAVHGHVFEQPPGVEVFAERQGQQQRVADLLGVRRLRQPRGEGVASGVGEPVRPPGASSGGADLDQPAFGLGLLLGPAAMLAPKRPGRHPWLGRAYQALTAALCLSAFGLVAYKPALWWLAVIGAATWGAALGGWWVRHRHFDGWLAWHIGLMCGSYISFVTAFLVVNLGFGSIPAWILPTLIGTPLIGRATARAIRPRRTAAP